MRLVIGLILILAALQYTAHSAGAISGIGPDPASHGGNTPRYTLENKEQISITNIRVPIYVPSQPTGNVELRVIDFKYPFPKINNIIQAYIGVDETNFNGAHVTGNTSLSIPASAFVLDQDTGYYKANIRANGTGGDTSSDYNSVAFRLSLNYPGGIIGIAGNQRYSTASGGYFSGNGSRVYENYSIAFATPCYITRSEVRTIDLYDLDSGMVDNGPLERREIAVRVLDETTGQIYSPTYTGTPGNNQTASYRVTFEPGHRYRLLLSNVWENNTLVYTFPYDNVGYAVNCNWKIRGESYIRSGTNYVQNNQVGKPGDTVNFKHDLRVNEGRLNRDFSWTMRGSGFRNDWYRNPGDSALNHRSINSTSRDPTTNMLDLPKPYNTLFAKYGVEAGYDPSYTVYDITQADVGNSLCQHIEWFPESSSSNALGRSRPANNPLCATVPYRYTLTPFVQLEGDVQLAESGSSVGVRGSVKNDGPTKSNPADWQFSYVILEPGVQPDTLRGLARSTSAPCAYYTVSGVRSCQTSANGLQFQQGAATSGNRVFMATDQGTAQSTTVPHENGGYAQDGVEDLEVGSRICYGLSVKNAGHNTTEWAHSKMECVVISKRPLVQVWGGDLIAGRQKSVQGTGGSTVRTSVKSMLANAAGERRFYGSWSEYGIIASGQVQGMGSASAYADAEKQGRTTNNLCSLSYLTISNVVTGNTCSESQRLGHYSFDRARPAVGSRFASDGTGVLSGSVSLNDLVSDTVYTANPSTSSPASRVTLRNNADVPAAKWVVINAPQTDVVIQDDIRYANGPFVSTADIPQVIIIARNISIADTVGRVDAWLLASGDLNTCVAAGVAPNNTGLTSGVCNAPLEVNGPVAANRVFLNRTGGSGTGTESGDPAEIFNYRADAFLWGAANVGGTGKARTVLTTELPPRF